MKNLIRISLLSASLAAGSVAAPFMAIGDGAELFLTGTLGIRSDDNIFLSRNTESDLIFDIAPGVDIVFGKNAQLKGSLTLVDTFSNYSDNSGLNTNLFAGAFKSNFDDGKLKLGFNVSYTELNQNSFDIRGLTRRDVFNAGANTEVEISQLSKVGAGVVFNHENYKRRGYTDSDSLTVPIDFFYKWTEKTDLSFGYRYRDYRVDLGSDSTDHFFNVGARGEFSPKLKGRFAVGLNTRKLDRGGDDTQLGVESAFTYEISPKTSFDFGVSNDFGTSPQGAQQKNFILFGTINTKLSEEWSANVGVNYRSIDYGARTDDYFEGTLGAAYTVNANVKIVGGYVYRNYSSDVAANEFKNNVFSVAANFRY
ncbi:MAG: outer membrane beta-barrel protein [Verrucomicrobia bacterium]|nr:outer membrane beta-barrel protein [Verrucomicrobiota bacterium]